MNSFVETLKGLGPAKLAAMAAITAGIFAFFIYLMTRLAAPDLALLYGELDGQDSGQIVSTLDELKVPYELSPDGTRIFVPSSQVGRLRVAMAEQGLPAGGSIGYEIFDRSQGIGTTNFVQNINRVRALEGEIARTIKSVRNIKNARVHLVLPERQLFSREQQEPSASIILTLHGNHRSANSQVLAIQQLVASAVPGLKPRMVSIIDSKGNLLARSVDNNDPSLGANNSDELRVSFENRMVRTIEGLLSRSLGAGNIRAQVSADMDFDRVTENSEIFDPNGQVVRSTQTVEESSSDSDGQAPGVSVSANLPGAELPQFDEGTPGGSQSTRTEETTNYETSRTTRTHIRESGNVRRLSVAVMVNGKIGIDEDGNRTYEARSSEEIEQIKALVRSAAGLDEERGDRLEVVNIPFVDLSVEEDLMSDSLFWGIEKAEIMRLAEIFVLGILAILVLVFVVRPLIQRLLSEEGFSIQGAGIAALPGGPATSAALGAPDPTGGTAMLEGGASNSPRLPRASGERSVADEIEQMIDVNKIEGRVRDSSIRKIGEIIQKHPDEAVNILRNWLYQDA